MGKSVEEMGEAMDADEYRRWEALGCVEPVGDARLDYLMGLVAATVVNAVGGLFGKSPRLRPSDMVPDWAESGDPVKAFRRVMRREAQRLDEELDG